MLRQLHIFLKSELLYVKDYAIALGTDELNNVKSIIQKYIDMPMPGKTFQRPVSNFQIFHRASENLYFLFVTDIVDSLQYINMIMIKTIKKFKELFPNPQEINESSPAKNNFNAFLDEIQKELHSKIVLVGPTNAGKTTLYNMLKSAEEKTIMEVAKSSSFEIDGISFDLWDFQLKDNFSLLWSKFIKGSDLVILLFNLANYNLRMLNRFLKLHQTESNYSKLLIIGNKRDLVEDADIRRIKNQLNIADFKEISLTDIDAKSQIQNFIMESLGLKKKITENFEELIREVDNLVLEGKKVQALAKYKQLITISESYQNIIFTKVIEQKITDLNKKIQEQTEKRKESEKKMDFDISKPLMFSRKVTVKPLPTTDTATSDQFQDQEALKEESQAIPSKPAKGLVSFQKLDKDIDIKPLKIPKAPQKTIKKASISQEISKEPQIDKTDNVTKPKAKMPIEIFSPHEDIKKEIEKPLIIDFTKELQKIIISKGSSLSLNLCKNLIIELERSLGRPVTIQDVELAADFFVKQEQLS